MGRMLADTGKPVCVVQEGGYNVEHLAVDAAYFFK